jgi:hypothetical protein
VEPTEEIRHVKNKDRNSYGKQEILISGAIMASSRASRRSAAQSRRSARSNGRQSRRSSASTGFRAITQGVGSSGIMPFGSLRGSSLRALNALDPYHLALPRPVGPYTVVRTNTVLHASNVVNSFCPEMVIDGGHTRWTHVLGRLSRLNSASPINGTDNCVVVNRGNDFFGPAVTMVPSAFTVQIMNPNALQTTSGIVYIGRSTAQYKLANDPRTWDQLAGQFVSFMNPRLCSAAKLALRGVKVDSYPLNMTEFSDFCPEAPIAGSSPLASSTWNADGTDANSDGEPSAFAPIVVYNPNQVALQYLITVEWRIRFDPSSAAAASHQFHRSSNMSVWDSVISSASSIGHGAMDIADVLSQVGSAYTSTQRVLRSFAPAPADVPLPAFG